MSDSIRISIKRDELPEIIFVLGEAHCVRLSAAQMEDEEGWSVKDIEEQRAKDIALERLVERLKRAYYAKA